METNELMIGDWVMFPHGIDRIVDLPYIEGRGLCASFAASATLFPVQLEQLKPIPLIAEILEKNGFAVGKYKLPISDKEIDKFSLSEVSNEYVREVVLLPITMNCTWNFSSVDGTCIPVIKYVHELQHALRLCGIEKTIEL